jgi:hypothetical protein
VIAEYTARGIQGHGFLFVEGPAPLRASQSAAVQAVIREPHGAVVARSAQSASAAATVTPDQLLFTTLANRTGGTFNLVLDNATIAPSIVNSDVDGDGIPDWRDFCPFNACAGIDFDMDGIPDNLDLCPATERMAKEHSPQTGVWTRTLTVFATNSTAAKGSSKTTSRRNRWTGVRVLRRPRRRHPQP